ncbi:DUF998 domain-containing protein [Kitasatospora sp. NPDC056138]|uniref:DUF998 domain-containing protein n=1 Tax=Kitasatospora sp. NPDC056138 TaxID=3345724 RepID=UPI0035E22633
MRWSVMPAPGDGGPCRFPADRRYRRGRWAAGLLLLAAVLYNDWLLEFALPTGLDPRHSYVSELYAADQPFRVLFSTVEITCAVLVTAAGLLAHDRTGSHWARTGWGFLAAFGVFSAADVALPMSCAPSVSHGCQAVHPWHTVTSALVHFALFASMTLLSVAGRTGRQGLQLVGRWGPRLLPCALVSAVATVGPLLGHPGWQGVPQRLHLVLVGLWFVLLAAALRRWRPWVGRSDLSGRESDTGVSAGVG